MRHPLLALILLAPLGGCGSEPAAAPAPEEAPEVADPALERFHRWSPRLAQGGDPRGEEDFARLARAGFAVVLSVDGKPPEVEAAARHGLRYVHLPIGYDGISPHRRLEIVKAVQQAEGPVYVHCHHGRHRGPAAAALARIALDAVAPADAVTGLAETCSPHYEGLFAAVAEFRAPDPAALAAVSGDLPSRVVPDDLVARMLDIDDLRGHLGDLAANGWRPLPEHPDLDPAHEALMLEEAYRELGRTAEARAHGERFERLLQESIEAATRLRQALNAPRDAAVADRAFEAVRQGCTGCHRAFRDA